MIYLIAFVIIAVTVVLTRMANKAAIERPGFANKIQAWAIGFWLASLATVIVVVVYYLNTHGINFQPKPISLN